MGKEEGRAEGQREEKVQIAKKLLSTGMPAKQVAEITGLEKEEIETF